MIMSTKTALVRGKRGYLVLNEHGKTISVNSVSERRNPYFWYYASTELNKIGSREFLCFQCKSV